MGDIMNYKSRANDVKHAARMIKKRMREFNDFLRIEINDSKAYVKNSELDPRPQLMRERSLSFSVHPTHSTRAETFLPQISDILVSCGISNYELRWASLRMSSSYGSYHSRKSKEDGEQNRKIAELINEINKEISKSQ